jgi:hypothetical protein
VSHIIPMNAADLYREAFASLPEGEFRDYQMRLGRVEPEIDQFVAQGRDSLDKLHRAASVAECDWGDATGPGVPVEDFAGARRLTVLALLRAERSFQRADVRAGLDDLTAVMALARQLGRGKYISGLASFPLEDLAFNKTLEVLGRLDPEGRRALAGRLLSLPAFPELWEAVVVEQGYFRGEYREKIAALDEGDPAEAIRKEFGLPPRTPENALRVDSISQAGDPAERMLIASGGTRTGLLKLADEVLVAFDVLVEVAKSDNDGAAGKLSELRIAAESNPLLADVLQTFDNMRLIWDRFRKRFEGLRGRVFPVL